MSIKYMSVKYMSVKHVRMPRHKMAIVEDAARTRRRLDFYLSTVSLSAPLRSRRNLRIAARADIRPIFM